MGKKQKYSNPFIDGITQNPSTSKPSNSLLEGFNTFKDPSIPSIDDTNKGVNLDDYKPYLGDSFVLTNASDYHRALNQSSGAQLGNAVLRFFSNVGLEFVNQGTNLVGGLDSMIESDKNLVGSLNQWAQETKQDVDKALPIYRKDPGKPLDIGDTAWWMENGTNLAQSAAAFVGLGYLTGGASIKAITKGKQALNWLNTLSKGTLTSAELQGIRGASTLANAALLNQAEGVGVATNVYNDVYNKKLGELQADPTMTAENTVEQLENIAKRTASEAASSALNFNRLNILLNLTSANMFLKTPALTRDIVKLPSIRKSLTKAGLEGIQEATEEEINLISEQQAKSPNYTFSNALEDVFTREGAESALLGFIGGFAQTGLTMSGRSLPIRKVGGENLSQNEIDRQRFLDQETAKTRWEELSSGEKLQSATDAFLTLDQQANLMSEIQSEYDNKNYERVEELKNTLLVNQARNAFETGTTDQLLNVFYTTNNLSQDKAAELGLYNEEKEDNPNHYKNQSKRAIETIEALEEEYINSKDYLNSNTFYNNNGEIQFKGVYDNRAENIIINNKIKDLDSISSKYRSSIKDIIEQSDIEDDSYSFSSFTGELKPVSIDLKDYRSSLQEMSASDLKDLAKSKNIPKSYALKKEDLINKLVDNYSESKSKLKQLINTNTYKEYQRILDTKNTLQKRQKDLQTEYVNITSTNTQRDIKNYLKKARKEQKEIKNREKVKVKKKENIQQNINKKEKFRQDTKENNTNEKKSTQKESTPIIDQDGDVDFSFTAHPDIDINQELNKILNGEYEPNLKKKGIKEAVKQLIDDDSLTPDQKTNLKRQANESFKYIDKLIENSINTTDNTVTNNLDQNLEELASLIEEDLSPTRETPSERRKRKTDLMLGIIDQAEQSGYITFKDLSVYTNNKLGAKRFSKIFTPFKDLYNGLNPDNRSELEYDDIFVSDNNKKEFIENDTKVTDNTLPFGVYTIDHNNLNNIHNQGIVALAKLNTLDTEGKSVDYGDIQDGVYKSIIGHDKIAYLAKNYAKSIKIKEDGTISVRKVDLDNSIRNIPKELLDSKYMKPGEEITLIGLNEVTLEDGTIINDKGIIQYPDGRVEERNPQEVAPIGILYNGNIVNGAFLHVAEWINEENVVGNVESDREALINIRREVLNAGSNGITTTIKSVSPGWLLQDISGEPSLTKDNLPDIKTFAISKNGQLHTNYETTITTINDVAFDNSIAAIAEIGEGKNFAIYLNKIKINEDYAKSIRKAVELYINGTPDNSIVKQLDDKYGINILTISGLKDYINRFVYSYDNFNGDSFEDFVKQQKSDVHLLRITGNTIEFGTGTGINIGGRGFNSISRNSPRQHLNVFLDNLEKHVKKMYINTDISRLGEKEFALPVIMAGNVYGDFKTYEEHIAEHTLTPYTSTKTEEGRPIYTIQRTFSFDTSNILKKEEKKEELEGEILGESVTEKPKSKSKVIKSRRGKNILISANDNLEDLSPLRIKDDEFQNILQDIPKDLYIKDISFGLQKLLIDSITSDVISEVVIDKKVVTKSQIFDENKKQLEEIKSVYLEVGSQKNADIVDKIINNFKEIVNHVENKLAKLDIIDIDLVQLNEDSPLVDSDSSVEKTSFESEAIFKVNPISSITKDIKQYLSIVNDVEVDQDGNIVYDDNNNIVDKVSIFGLNPVIPFDTVINDLYGILANNNEQYLPPSLNIMVDKLTEHIESKPYLANVIDIIENAPQDIKAKFVTAMSKHYTHHKYIYRAYDKKSKTYRLIPSNSDNYSNKNKVIQDWFNGLKESKYIKNTGELEENLIVTNQKEIENRFNKIVENLKEGKPIVRDLGDWLKDIGILVPDTMLVNIKNRGMFIDGNRLPFIQLMTSTNGVFNIIKNNLINRGDSSLESNNPFKDKAVSILASMSTRYINNVYSNSFSDVVNNTYFGYSPNKYFIERIGELNTDIELLRKLKQTSFSGNSTWLNELYKQGKEGQGDYINTEGLFYRNFKYFTVDGIKDGATKQGKKLEDMSPAEHEQYKLGHFFNQGGTIKGKKSRRIMETLYPTISDKSLLMGLSNVGYVVQTNTQGEIWDKSPIWNILYDSLIQPELNRIIENQTNPNKINLKGYEQGAKLFYFIPELNELEDIWIKEGDVKVLKNGIAKGSSEYQSIMHVLKKHVHSLIEQKKSVWDEYGFIETDKDNNQTLTLTDSKYIKEFGNNLNNIAAEYVVNYLINNANIYQLFIGDPALFYKKSGVPNATDLDNVKSTFVNVGVRLASHIAPGLDIPAEKGETFTTIFLEDREGDISENKAYLKTLLSENDYNAYKRVAGTDAQEFTTLEEHLNVMVRQGRINKEDYNRILDKEKRGVDLNTREMGIVLQPMKPVYNNKVWEGNFEKVVYIKSSSFPLIKQLTKGMEIDKLRIAMEEGKINRAAFSTAVKLGNIKSPINIFNEDGTIKDQLTFKQEDIQVLPRLGHRIQQEVPFKESKYKINDGTQQSKLLFNNLLDLDGFTLDSKSFTGGELRNIFNETYGDLYKLKYQDLMKELVNKDNKLDMEKLQKILYKEGLERNFPLNDLESLTLIEKNGNLEFKVPLWATASASKFEAMLSSIVDNRIRKRLVYGKSYVLGTEEGFRTKEIEEVSTVKEALDLQPGIIFDEKWIEESGGKLRSMRVENGKVLPDEVILPMKFYNNKGQLIDIKQFVKDGYLDTERIDPQLLKMFGFRIPTQGHNSMSYMRVVGFLPYETGDLLIAPRDFTTRMGSDFDVDKIYVNSYHTSYNMETGVIMRLRKGDGIYKEENAIQDRLLDIHFSVLENSNSRIQGQIHTPLGFGMLEDLANTIDKAVEENNLNNIYKWSGVSENYQRQRYLSARGSKAGVGSFSLDSTFNSLLQGNEDIKLVESIGDELIELEIKLGGRVSNSISTTTVNTKGSNRFKSDAISAYQSASVDNEKVQLLNRLNINKFTFSAIRALNQMGFEEDVVMYFINQPIIRDYINYLSLSQDSASNWDITKVTEQINKDYPSELDEDKLEEISNVSLEDMQSMIFDLSSIDNSEDLQQALLYKFQKLSSIGDSIAQVQSTINSDSAGVGKNIFYSLIKEDQIIRLDSNKSILNSHKLIGDYWRPEYVKNWQDKPEEERNKIISDKREEGYVPVRDKVYIKPTTINGYASIYGTVVNAKLWDKLFGYDSFPLIKTIEEIVFISGKSTSSINIKAESYGQAWNFIKSYLLTNAEILTDNSLIEERKRLLLDTKDNKSLASILKNIQDNKLIKDNPFINRLNVELFKQVIPSTISYNSSLAEGVDETYIYSGLIDLMANDKKLGIYNGIEYTTRKLVQDLITYQFITGGIQRATQFIKYIPISYLENLGYYESIKNINFKDTRVFGFNKDKLSNVTEQYIQHYPDIVAQYELEGISFNKNRSTITITNSDEFNNSRNGLIDYISIPDKNTKIGYRLYKYMDNNTYYQIDTLGYKDIRETNREETYSKSIIASNISPIQDKIEVELPKSDNEIKESLVVNSERELVQEDKNIPPLADKGIEFEYGISNISEPGIKKIGNALNQIIVNSDNNFYKFYADEMLKNISKLPTNIRMDIVNTLQAEGKTTYDNNYRPTGIYINTSNLKTKEDFERVLLHELTHAFTKQAIKEGDSNTISRLDSIYQQYKKIIRFRYSGKEVENTIKELKSNGRPIKGQKDIEIYAISSLEEFITAAISDKKIQAQLNDIRVDQSNKSIWESFKGLITDLLEKFGFKKGNALDYVVSNTISLIQTDPSSSVIIGEVETKPHRTVEFINTKLNLVNENGEFIPKKNSKQIARWINNNIANLQADEINGVIHVYDKNIVKRSDSELFDLSISRRILEEEQEELPIAKLLKTRNTRIKTLDRLINQADAKNEFAKAEELKQQRQELEDQIEDIKTFTTLESVETIAIQDLDEVSNMLNNNMSESDILYALRITNLWQKGIDVFFDEDTLTSDILRDKFKSIEGKAEYLSEVLYNKLVDLTNQFVAEHTGVTGNINVEQIMASMKDISRLEANVLNLSRNDNVLLTAIYNSVKKANYAALDESQKIIKNLDELVDNVKDILPSKGERYEVFRQKFSDGLYTGNLVSKFTPEFEEALRESDKQLRNIKDKEVFKKYAKNRKESIITFDVRKLFPRTEGKFTEEQIDSYKKELKELLGKSTFDRLMKRQERSIKRYEEDRTHNLNRILDKYDLVNESDLKDNKKAKDEFFIWILRNSPYEIATQLIDGKPYTVNGKFFAPSATKYLVNVPKKTNNKGKDLGFYDNNFSTIENNSDLLDFYNYITDVFDELKIYLPQEVQERIQFGGLPEISKSFLELSYDVKGGKEAMSVIWDKLKESVRTNDLSDITYADIDPVTGQPNRFLEVKLMKDNYKEYKDYIYRKSVEFTQNNPDIDPTEEQREKWRHEAKDFLAQRKSYDLGKVVKAYSMLVLAYKHKSRIEDQLKAAETIIRRSREAELTAKRKPLRDEKGNIVYKNTEDSFTNMKSSLEYFMDVYYGHARKLEGVTKKKVLTSEEEKLQDELIRLLHQNKVSYEKGRIDQDEFDRIENTLNKQLDELGGLAVWSKRGDNVLKYIQLKVMGWNLFSGFSNVGFGWIANFIEAADGRVFNNKDLLMGYRLVLHSIGKNLTFGHVKSDTAIKIRSLMDRFDVLKDMSNELYKDSIPNEFSDKLKWLAPYNITQRTEYINQAPLMIALMNNMKTENGKTLWEQFDKEGNWIGEGDIPNELLTKFRLRLDSIIEKTHGDYGSPLKIKGKILGRGLSQFRTWMFEGFAQRFEPEKFDPNLGIVRKGRYRSFNPYFNRVGYIGGLADMANNLLRKLTFRQTKFDNLVDGEIFNEVDAANMRKVLSEIVIYINLSTVALLLKSLTGELDDEEKYMANYLINHSSRLRTDILFYFNPIEFRKLLRDPLPAATLIKDVTEWSYATGNFVIGKDEYETGVYAGESRLFRETMQLLPFGTQVYRNISASKTQY